jgi:hypothetical protein
MSFEHNQGFLNKFQGITEEELNKILKDNEITLYKDYELGKTYTGYFSYNFFRLYVKVENGKVVQVTT